MSKQLSMDQVVRATLDGFVAAQNEYFAWSGGYWLQMAPEYLITTSVAKKIYQSDGAKFITLENGARSALQDAGAKGTGRVPFDMRENGKMDILLWWGAGSPRGVIEIKNKISSNVWYKDIKRIRAFLNRKEDESSLQFGLFAFYESACDGSRKTAEQKVSDSFDRKFLTCKELLGDLFTIVRDETKVFREDESAWAASVFLIKK